MVNPIDFALNRNEEPFEGIRRVTDALLDGSLLVIAQPTDDRDEDVHVVRASIKHLRALLRLLRPVLGDREFHRRNSYLRASARMLSEVRDAAVAVQTLQDLEECSDEVPQKEALIEAASRLRRQSRHFTRTSRETSLEQTGQRLAAAKLLTAASLDSPAQWAVITASLERVYGVCRRRLKKALKTSDPLSLHRWRIRVKNLYFQILFLESIRPKRFGKLVKKLRKLQTFLGRIHDLASLETSLMGPKLEAETLATVLIAAEAERLRLVRKAFRLGAKVFEEKPSRFIRGVRKHLPGRC